MVRHGQGHQGTRGPVQGVHGGDQQEAAVAAATAALSLASATKRSHSRRSLRPSEGQGGQEEVHHRHHGRLHQAGRLGTHQGQDPGGGVKGDHGQLDHHLRHPQAHRHGPGLGVQERVQQGRVGEAQHRAQGHHTLPPSDERPGGDLQQVHGGVPQEAADAARQADHGVGGPAQVVRLHPQHHGQQGDHGVAVLHNVRLRPQRPTLEGGGRRLPAGPGRQSGPSAQGEAATGAQGCASGQPAPSAEGAGAGRQASQDGTAHLRIRRPRLGQELRLQRLQQEAGRPQVGGGRHHQAAVTGHISSAQRGQKA